MLYSDELKKFLELKDTPQILALNGCINQMNSIYEAIKKEMANELVNLFMIGDSKQISKLVSLGQEIDKIIELNRKMIIEPAINTEDDICMDNTIDTNNSKDNTTCIQSKSKTRQKTTLIKVGNDVVNCPFCNEKLNLHDFKYEKYKNLPWQERRKPTWSCRSCPCS